MPELPEVETVKETLKKQRLYQKIIGVDVFYPSIIEYPTSDEFKKKIINQKICNIDRKGKWLIFELEDYYLLSHLRMEGKYFIREENEPQEKHEHVAFYLEDGRSLRYRDTRKFGRMHLILKEELYTRKPLSELGLEPWDKELTVSYLKEKYKNKKLPIKTVILDQNIITGIGNIYADEILFLCHLSPFTPCSDIKEKDLLSIIENTRTVLEKAIELGGSTIRTYESSEGVHGLFQNELLVHNHAGEKCSRCGETILKTRIGGRGTYYCPICQKV